MCENRFYICEKCGNLVGAIHESGVPMMCCGEKMQPVIAGTVDADKEKHLPVITRNDNSIHVKVGSIEHPMLNAHHIMWIELIAGDKVMRKYLNPGDKPEAEFQLCSCTMDCGDKIIVREYCNLHGLWQSEL